MIKVIDVEVIGSHYNLLFNNSARFSLIDKFGNDDAITGAIGASSAEQLENTLDIFYTLAEQGELARRYCGYDEGDLPDRADFEFLSPGDVMKIINAIYAAVTMGYNREVPSMDDVDLGLIELEKKNHIKT